jgi:hypothetical protein
VLALHEPFFVVVEILFDLLRLTFKAFTYLLSGKNSLVVVLNNRYVHIGNCYILHVILRSFT